MIRISQDEWRRAFSVWLRTGRLPVQKAGEAELKFNPWHDPDDGRFTFSGSGVYYGRGSSGAGNGGKRSSGSTADRRPEGRPSAISPGGGSFGGGGFGGSRKDPKPRPRPSGGSYGGGGAAGGWETPEDQRRRPNSTRAAIPGETTRSPAEQFRTVVRNDYTYQIDMGGRTRRVSGAITLSEAPLRSRTSQRQAGGVDRRTSDDGGHYIAARFKGPTDAFNHFAQDANFNRGGYRLLEDEWARAKRAGKRVTVTIVPYYDGPSKRPYEIDVWFTIDGRRKSKKFPNERSESARGRQ